MTRGIVYVAWGQQHLQEACRSAKLNKSGYPTCLMTSADSLSIALDETFGTNYSLAMLEQHFNSVQIVDFTELAKLPSIYWRKLASLLYSPFSTTLFVDSDCFILGDLSLGFELAEEGFFCTTISPHLTFVEKGKEYVLHNGGVYFCQTPAQKIVDVFLSLIPTTEYSGDEGVISLAIRQQLIKHHTLPETFTVCRSGQGPPVPIQIFHSRTLHGNPPEFLYFDYYGNRQLSNW